MLPCPHCRAPVPTLCQACPACSAPQTGAQVLPAVGVLLGLSIATAQDEMIDQPEYGVAFTDDRMLDTDADGYTPLDGDCDDNNPEIHPGAADTDGDGIDADCDGQDGPPVTEAPTGPLRRWLARLRNDG